jgi:hypothetical protein
MRLISAKPMQNCSIEGCYELNAGKLSVGTFVAVTQTLEGPAVIPI